MVPPSQTIAEIATSAGSFSTLLLALEATNLAGLVADAEAGPFTVFAPLDSAFAELGMEVLTALNNDLDTLENILLYHIVIGELIGRGDLRFLDSIEMANGDTVSVSRRGKVLNGSRRFVAQDIVANNGVVHVIDQVLLPPNLEL